MADSNFVVKNGLVVNTAVTINSTAIYFGGSAVVNSTVFVGQSNTALTANNSTNLGGSAAAGFVQNTDSRSLSGNLAFTAANVYFTSGLFAGANVNVNTSAVFVGNSSQNAYITSAGLYVNGAVFTSGGGYYKGNQGTLGSPSNANSLFRINANTMSNNITIAAGENAQVTGPLAVDSGFTLTIQTGGRAVVI